MSHYTELVKALRETATFTKFDDLLSKREQKLESLAFDAAAAIEALIGTVGDLQAIRERLEEENDALRLEPKRGEIVRCRECRWGHLCVMGQHLGLDGFCSKGEREVQE